MSFMLLSVVVDDGVAADFYVVLEPVVSASHMTKRSSDFCKEKNYFSSKALRSQY